MNIKKITCALALSMAAMFPLASHATAVPAPAHLIEADFTDILYPKAKLNKNLGEGEYDFVGLHGKQGKTFTDEWKFTLADTSDVVVSLTDYELSLGGSFDAKHTKGDKKANKLSVGYLLNNKLLSFSLFDSDDHLLGTSGEGGTLSALGLAAGEWYTITVSAKVSGIFGSAYHGTLAVTPTAVPLTDALPLFASALMVVVGAKRRKAIAQ